MFYILAAVLGYLIMKKLDESDLYITKTDKKTRHKHREIREVSNVFHKGEYQLLTKEKTDLGIPVSYWQDEDGRVVRTYGDNHSIIGMDK